MFKDIQYLYIDINSYKELDKDSINMLKIHYTNILKYLTQNCCIEKITLCTEMANLVDDIINSFINLCNDLDIYIILNFSLDNHPIKDNLDLNTNLINIEINQLLDKNKLSFNQLNNLSIIVSNTPSCIITIILNKMTIPYIDYLVNQLVELGISHIYFKYEEYPRKQNQADNSLFDTILKIYNIIDKFSNISFKCIYEPNKLLYLIKSKIPINSLYINSKGFISAYKYMPTYEYNIFDNDLCVSYDKYYTKYFSLDAQYFLNNNRIINKLDSKIEIKMKNGSIPHVNDVYLKITSGYKLVIKNNKNYLINHFEESSVEVNDTGAIILQCLDTEVTLLDILYKVFDSMNDYDISKFKLANDVTNFVNFLIDKKLIQIRNVKEVLV